MRALTTVALLVLAGAPVDASDRNLATVWTIADDLSLPVERDLLREDFVIKQRLMPTGVAQFVDQGAASAIDPALASAQLVELKSTGVVVFCDPEIRGQKAIGHAQPCFVDTDSDGRFESMFFTSSVTKGLLTVQGNRPKNSKPILPIAYRQTPIEDFKPQYFVGIQYRGNANIFGNHIFEINYGSKEKMGSLTERFLVKKNEIPAMRTPFGGKFTLLSEFAGGIRIRVDKPFPKQHFGIVQTTTYRVY